MFKKLFILSIIICGAFQLPASAEEQAPLFLLYFDINKTIIAEDATSDKSLEYIVTHQLAERCVHQWDPCHAPMSYYDYVKTVLVPGPKTKENKRKRNLILNQFIKTLETSNYPQKNEMIALYNECIKKMEGKYLIPSFVKLLQTLKEQEVAFRIILRTYGSDIRTGKITQKIEKILDGERFTYQGNFQSGNLKIKGLKTMKKTDEIYRFFRDTHGHVAIQDHWKVWSDDQERGRSGKPFIFDPNDSEVISMFFDDNVNPDPYSEYNIIRPLPLNKEPDCYAPYYNRNIFKADTLEAIINPDYYVDMVLKPIH